jgi:hypothetical protein
VAIAGDAVDVDDDIDEDSDMTSAGVAPPGAQAVPLRSPEGYMCEPAAGLGPPVADAASGKTLANEGPSSRASSWHRRRLASRQRFTGGRVQEGASGYRVGGKQEVVSCM